MKTIKIIDLIKKIANGEELPKKIKYDSQVFEYREDMLDYYCYDYDLNLMGYQKVLNDEVEILEEEKKDNFTGWKMYQDGKEVCSMDCSAEEEKELHANDIEFNINNDKRDCIITLDENDLGIDKLHLDNCYFFKENDKWYVKKYNFKTIKIEEEKKIPEKLPKSVTDNAGSSKDMRLIANTLNQVIDYLKSKGE